MLEDIETIQKIVLEVDNMTLRKRREYLKQYTKEEAKVIYKYIGKLKTKPREPIKPIEDIKPIFKYENWRESEIKECEPIKPIKQLKPLTKPRYIYFEEGEDLNICRCEPDAIPKTVLGIENNKVIIFTNPLNKDIHIINSKYIINIENDIINITYTDKINFIKDTIKKDTIKYI